MNNIVLLDNDIIIKSSQLLISEEVRAEISKVGHASLLSAAKFALRGQVTKRKCLVSLGDVQSQSEVFIASCAILESSEEEIALAAELEDLARESDCDLDAGESQLCAILLIRNCKLLITGDKRAISALGTTAHSFNFEHRLACFEQLIRQTLHTIGWQHLRELVCNQPQADRALTLCFSCSSKTTTEDSTLTGIESYINDIRSKAPNFLIAGNDLSSMIS